MIYDRINTSNFEVQPNQSHTLPVKKEYSQDNE